jgi:hypothetical protein
VAAQHEHAVRIGRRRLDAYFCALVVLAASVAVLYVNSKS